MERTVVMTALRLATAFTPDYARAANYMDTLQKHCNIPFQLLVVGQDMPSYGMPRSIVQAGYFLPHLKSCDVVIFTDADILMHRPLDFDEVSFLFSLKEGQVSACYNHHGEELFAEEAKALAPIHELHGFDDVRVFNTGFVAARYDTYYRVWKKFIELWPMFDEAFAHYAKIQLCMCAAVHALGFEWVVTPEHLCSHGHFGLPPGVEKHDDGPPTFNGRVISFDHRLSH